VAVFAPGAMQVCGGRVHVTDRTAGGRVFAAGGQSSVEIGLAGVRACHLVCSTVAHGPTSAIELDDADGRCVAVVTQFGIVGEDVHAAWEHLAASLPDA
jgi:putative hemin transport protein